MNSVISASWIDQKGLEIIENILKILEQLWFSLNIFDKDELRSLVLRPRNSRASEHKSTNFGIIWERGHLWFMNT